MSKTKTGITMKYLIVIMVITPLIGVGQSFQATLKGEQTVKGVNYELGVAYEIESRFAFGAFFQQSEPVFRNDGLAGQTPSYGVSVQVPIYTSDKLMLSGLMRAGLVSERFLVVLPAMETRWMFFKRTGGTLTAGYRYGYPSAAFGLLYKITVKK